MSFNWINFFGFIIVLLLMIPNIINAMKHKEKKEEKAPSVFYVFEQIGRYLCIALMVLPLFVWEFGFDSVAKMTAYIAGSAFLLILYYLFWFIYSKRKTMINALALAVIPSFIFLLCGLMLNHWLLVIFSLIFGVFHTLVTVYNE